MKWIGPIVVLSLVGAIGVGVWKGAGVFNAWLDSLAKKFSTSAPAQAASTALAHALPSGVALTPDAQSLIDAGVLDTTKPAADRIATYKQQTGVFPKWLPGVGDIDADGNPTGTGL